MTTNKYTEQVHNAAVRAAEAGGTKPEIAKASGISRTSFNRWMRKYPKFRSDIEAAMQPTPDTALIQKLEQRRKWAEEWLDDYLRTRGEIVEISITSIDETGQQKTIKTTNGKMPDLRLIDRILGINTSPEEFVLKIEIAEPEPDDDDELDDDE